jgi:monoterpene epsilon-lactone hydrolase
MASAELNKVLELLKSQPRNPSATVAQMRAGMERVSEHVARDVTCETLRIGDIAAEWIVPPGVANDRVILYLHGGGFVMGSIATHRATVARIARASKARALAIEYRLAPEHQFPAAVDDSVAAYKWLLGQGYQPGKIVIAGDSAGGGLTLSALLAIRDAKLPMAAAGVAISPWADLEGTGDSFKTRAQRDPMVGGANLGPMAKHYIGEQDPKNPLASPIHADYHGIAPLLIQVGDAETLLDDSNRVAARAKADGVKVDLEVWDDMIHVWHAFAKILPEGQQAIDKIGKFVVAHTP